MATVNKEELSNYVSRVMAEKGLSVRDVQAVSGGKITASYVSGIVNETSKNLSVSKLQALATGLDVSEEEVFKVARGLSGRREVKASAETRLQSLVLLDVRKKTVLAPDLAEIVRELWDMDPEDRAAILKSAKTINETKRKQQRNKKVR